MVRSSPHTSLLLVQCGLPGSSLSLERNRKISLRVQQYIRLKYLVQVPVLASLTGTWGERSIRPSASKRLQVPSTVDPKYTVTTLQHA